MGQTRLSLEAPEVTTNCILKLFDTSSYNTDVVASCPRLQITVPGFSTAVYIDNVPTEFNLNLTACDLKIQKDNCGKQYNDLPDGIYVIRYSVSPNDVVYVEYNHLRVTKSLNRLKALYCDLDLENCAPSPQKKKQREDARIIKDYLTGAKSYVEYCRQAKQGLELFKEANKMLDKFKCKGCH